MSEELQPMNCGCGGEAEAHMTSFNGSWFVICRKCRTMSFGDTEVEAVTAWNRAISGNHMELQMVEQKKGKWMFAGKQTRLPFIGICSVCGHYESAVWIISHRPNYCPNCGAKLIWSENEL